MFAVNGQYGGTVFLCQTANQGSGHNERLLVGKADGLAGAYGMNRWRKAGKANHGREHHVYRSRLDNLVDGLCPCIDLDVGFGVEQRLQTVVMCLVGYYHRCGLELDGLLGQLLHPVVGRKAIHLIKVAVFLYHFKSLGSDGAC